MTFLHKLAKRLARLRVVQVMGLVVVASCEILPARIMDPAGALAKLDLSPPTLTLLTDRTTDFVVVGLTAAGDTADVAAVTWTATGGSVTPMSSTDGRQYGRYRAPAQPGSYKVLARTTTGGIADSSVVSVSAVPVAAVTISPVGANVAVGGTALLTATPRDAGGAPLAGRITTWSTSNAAVATVSGGLVTGVGAGATTVTATSEGINGTAATTVTQVAVASVSVSPASVSVAVGQTTQLTATPRDAGGTALAGRVVTWGSSNSAAATVNGSGLVTTVAAGSTTITASSEGISGTAAVSVTQAPLPVASVTMSPTSASLLVGATQQLTATPRDAGGTALVGRVITWGSSNTTVATVSGSGLVTARVAGPATITATSEGRNATAAITVTTPPPPPPPPGGTWPNEPAGFTTINDFGWTAVNAGGWTSNGGINIVADATAPLSPSSVAEFRYQAGFTSGGVAPGTTYISVGGQRVMYVGYWWKPSNPWQGHDSGINKIMFLVSNDFSNDVIMTMRGSGSGPFKLDTYVNGTYLGSNVNNPNVALGVWHRIELYVNANTGVVRWWMDGVLYGDRSGVGFGGAAFSEFQFSPTWGGVGGANKAQTDYYWYDHVHISRQ